MILGIVKVMGTIFFLYLLWRNLRESYDEKKLVVFGWASLLAFVVGSRLAYGLLNWGKWETVSQWFNLTAKPGMIYEGGIAAVLLLIWWMSRINNWKIWSFIEDITALFYGLMAIIVLDEWWWNKDIKLLAVGLTMLFGWALAIFFKGKYRSYLWYRSGKKGFIFGMDGVIIFLLLTAEAILFKEGLGVIVFYLIMSLISGVQLVILGEIWKRN
ncbi:MAG: hypothetical protein NTY75_00715 [Candidatus Shapirobacteria bacterium]|nr:hypothetical protein [Candidatus Shapirobacteria bacterium]